jgi:hypothetical protein
MLAAALRSVIDVPFLFGRPDIARLVTTFHRERRRV